jgi:hypothetical protein
VLKKPDKRRNARKLCKTVRLIRSRVYPISVRLQVKNTYGPPTSTSDIIIDTLSSARALEYIEANFYIMTHSR